MSNRAKEIKIHYFAEYARNVIQIAAHVSCDATETKPNQTKTRSEFPKTKHFEMNSIW